MSHLYLAALCGFAAVMLAILFDAVAGVTRKPVWHAYRSSIGPVEAAAPARVEPQMAAVAALAAAGAATAVQPIEVHDVEERHSGFVGLTNDEDFQLTA